MAENVATLVEGVIVQTSRLWNTNSTVITGVGREANATIVVDPGWFPDEIEDLRRIAAETPPGRATHVLFTHGDYDHVVAWDDFDGAQLIAHPEAARRDATQVERQVADLDKRRETIRSRPYRYPPVGAFPAAVAECLDLGGERALFFPAPGHQSDGLFTLLPERRVLIAGDYLSDEEFPFIYHSLPDYRSTLLLAKELCGRYGITMEVPGHGQVATTSEEIEYRISTDLDYLDRLEAGVNAARADGLSCDEAMERLASFTFRGEPISNLLKAHIDNVRILYGVEREWEPS
jgi:hydroxyacylglutathione hydrolase